MISEWMKAWLCMNTDTELGLLGSTASRWRWSIWVEQGIMIMLYFYIWQQSGSVDLSDFVAGHPPFLGNNKDTSEDMLICTYSSSSKATS